MQHPLPAPARPSKGTVRVRAGIGTTDSRGRGRRMFTWVLLGGVTVLLVNAIIGENGYLATLRLERTEAALMNAVARVRVENQQLRDERLRLETDPNTIADTIREQLGYIRPGENAVVVHEIPAVPVAPSTPVR
jgi:cell division protein FtsB